MTGFDGFALSFLHGKPDCHYRPAEHAAPISHLIVLRYTLCFAKLVPQASDTPDLPTQQGK
jgi:hypothetical protein